MKLRILIALAGLVVCGAGCAAAVTSGFTVSAPSPSSPGAGTAITGGAELLQDPVQVSP